MLGESVHPVAAWQAMSCCLQVTLVDTAGLRDSTDEIEQMGMRRARSAMTSADIIAVVMDPQTQPELSVAARKVQQQGQGVATWDPAKPAATDAIVRVACDLLREVACLKNQPHAGSAAEVADDWATDRRDLSAAEKNAVSRPQHQQMLVILNKSDLQPVPYLAAPHTSSAPLASTSDATTGLHGGMAGSSNGIIRDTGSWHQASHWEDMDTNSSSHGAQLASSGGSMPGSAGAVAISCKTGEGLNELLVRLSQLVTDMTSAGDAGEGSTIITR